MESLEQIQAINLLKANIREIEELAFACPDPIARAKILLLLADKQARLLALQKTPRF